MKFLSVEQLGPHRYKTPEGYLICVDAIIARTGKQEYKESELFTDLDSDNIIEVNRPYNEVFSPETISSFENKPLCNEHPDSDVTTENYKELSVGYIRDIHKGTIDNQDVLMANIIVTDPEVINEIETNQKVELSCGYDCQILKDNNGNYYQHQIRGNHLALCDRGRAGNARIQDSEINDTYYVYLETTKGTTLVGKSDNLGEAERIKNEAKKKNKNYINVVLTNKQMNDMSDMGRFESMKKETREIFQQKDKGTIANIQSFIQNTNRYLQTKDKNIAELLKKLYDDIILDYKQDISEYDENEVKNHLYYRQFRNALKLLNNNIKGIKTLDTQEDNNKMIIDGKQLRLEKNKIDVNELKKLLKQYECKIIREDSRNVWIEGHDLNDLRTLEYLVTDIDDSINDNISVSFDNSSSYDGQISLNNNIIADKDLRDYMLKKHLDRYYVLFDENDSKYINSFMSRNVDNKIFNAVMKRDTIKTPDGDLFQYAVILTLKRTNDSINDKSFFGDYILNTAANNLNDLLNQNHSESTIKYWANKYKNLGKNTLATIYMKVANVNKVDMSLFDNCIKDSIHTTLIKIVKQIKDTRVNDLALRKDDWFILNYNRETLYKVIDEKKQSTNGFTEALLVETYQIKYNFKDNKYELKKEGRETFRLNSVSASHMSVFNSVDEAMNWLKRNLSIKNSRLSKDANNSYTYKGIVVIKTSYGWKFIVNNKQYETSTDKDANEMIDKLLK